MTAAGPLQDVRVFDLTRGGVGPWASMILAWMGASVIKVESPGGDPLQTLKPRIRNLSAVYLHTALGKRAAVIDLKSPVGGVLARRLIRDADVYLDNMKFGSADRLGLGFADAVAENPQIVYAQCPGWGDRGPYRDWGSTDLSVQAFSGAASSTGARSGSPEVIRWYALHDFNASSYIVVGILLGLLRRLRSGEPTRILAPQVGASLAIQTSLLADYLAGAEEPRPMGSGSAMAVPDRAFNCGDQRWLAVTAETPGQWARLCRAIGAAGLLEDDRFVDNDRRLAHREVLEGQLGAIFATQPARWWLLQLRRARVPVSLFRDAEGLVDDPQVRASRVFQVVNYAGIGRLPFGRPPIDWSRTPGRLRSGPVPGRDTEQIAREGWGSSVRPMIRAMHGPSSGIGPAGGVLEGVTVVDLTEGLTGPYASLVLADAGARVIKVERGLGDWTRHIGLTRVGDMSGLYHQLNRNKEGIRLDPGVPEDRDRLQALIATADVLLEDDLVGPDGHGIEPSLLATADRRLVHCRISPHGRRGHLASQPASELTLQAMSGFLNYLGVRGEEPVRMGPDMASLGAGLFAVMGILAALVHVWRTGEGQVVDVNQLGTLLFQHGITFTSSVGPDEWSGFYLDGDLKPPNHGLRADDQRIVLNTIASTHAFRGVLEDLGALDYLTVPLFQSTPRELTNPGVSGQLAVRARPYWEAAFKGRAAEDLVGMLNRYDSHSALLNSPSQALAHPQTRTLGMVDAIDAPGIGRVRVLRPPWQLGGVDGPQPRPYRLLGADDPASRP